LRVTVVKVKLSLFLSTTSWRSIHCLSKHHARKTYWGREGLRYSSTLS